MITVTITVRNPMCPTSAPRVEVIKFASEWACQLMCDEYVKCIDVESVTAVSELTGEIIFLHEPNVRQQTGQKCPYYILDGYRLTYTIAFFPIIVYNNSIK